MILTKRQQSERLKQLTAQDGMQAIFDLKKWPQDAQIVGRMIRKNIAEMSLCLTVKKQKLVAVTGMMQISENEFHLLEISPSYFAETVLEYKDNGTWKVLESKERKNEDWPAL